MSLPKRWFLMLLAAASTSACGSSDGGPADPGTPPQTPRITITVSASTLTVEAGSSGTLTATITRSGGYSGAVAIVTTGAPAGVTAVESNVVTNGSTTSGTITVTVPASVAAGSYPLTVTASGAEVSSVQATLSLVVTAAPPTPDFAVAITSPLALVQGAIGNATLTFTRTNYTGPIVLSATGAPAGVTTSFAPSAPTGNTSMLTISVGGTVPAGSYSIQIVGTGTPGARSATLTLTVSVAGSYTLVASPNAVTLPQAGSVSTTITVTPSNGFTGAVTLGVTGLPAGMTASFNPATTSTTSTLTLVTAGAVAGTANLAITGATAGLPAVTAPLGVTVMPVNSPTAITLDYSACPMEERVLWIAYRDGAGAAWTPVTGVADRYTFTLSGAIGGLAVATTNGVGVFLQRTTWLEDFAERPCQLPVPERTISGTATNLPTNADGWVGFGNSSIQISSSRPTFSLTEVPLGMHDLIGYVRSGAGLGANDRGFLRRDVNPAPPGIVSAVDFSGSESFAPEVASVTVVGAGGQALLHSMSYATRAVGASCDIAELYDQLPASGNVVPTYGVPTSRQRADDLHVLNIRASTTTGQTTVFQEALESFHTLTSRTVSLPGAFTPTVTRVTGGSYHRFRVQGTLPAELDGVLATSSGLSSDLQVVMLVGPDWLSGSNVDLTMPDFTGLTGFNPAWAPGSVETAEYNVVGVNNSGFASLTQQCGANVRVAGAGKEGVLP